MLGVEAASVTGALADGFSIAILVARIVQSLVHVCFVQTDAIVSLRFALFSVQIVSFICLIAIIVIKVGGSG